MLGNNIGFSSIRHNEKDYFNGVPFFQTTFGEWFRDQKGEHRQELLRTAKRLVGIKGRGGSRFGALA